MFCHLILSFVCAHISPGLSVYAHIYIHYYTQVSGRPGLDNEVGFIGCPCALGFSFIATTHTFVPSRPPFHVFILLSLLRASTLCLPSGRRVCVCTPSNHTNPVGLCFGTLPYFNVEPENSKVCTNTTSNHYVLPARLV